MTSCQTFRNKLGDLKPEDLQGLLETYTATTSPDIERELEEKLSPIRAFVKEYQDRTKDVLARWYPYKDEDKQREFVNSIAFGDDQRVIIKGNLDINSQKVTSFPSVIKEVDGQIDIVGTSIQTMDWLEQAESLNATNLESLSSLKRLKKLKYFLYIIYTNIKELPSLESVGDATLAHTPLESLPLLKEADYLSIDDTMVSALPHLEIVHKGLSIKTPTLKYVPFLKEVGRSLNIYDASSLTCFPSLEKVGWNILIGNVPSLAPKKDQPWKPNVSFASFFPKLREVGQDNGTSFNLGKEYEIVKNQLMSLRKQGKIKFDGTIYLREN